MSNITTIAQIKNEKANGEIIMAIQVTLKGVYERRQINAGTPKATTVQTLVLQDETGEIRASLWGHPPADEHKGKQFVIHSNKNPRGAGFVGVSVKDGQDQNGNARRELQISGSATIQFVEVYNASPAAKAAPSSAPAQAPTAPKSATQPATNGPITLEGIANFWEWCYVEADKRQRKFGFNDTMKQACVGSLFIQGMRDGVHRGLTDPAPWAAVNGGAVVGAVQATLTDTKPAAGQQQAPADEDVPF